MLTADKHPQADKLQVLTVDAGEGEPVQVVCGAPNARAGMLGVFGPPGANIPGSDMTLKVAAIRGVESRGMMCSSASSSLATTIAASSNCPAMRRSALYSGICRARRSGVRCRDHAQPAGCMGVRGIARDLAAAGIGTLKPLAVPQIEGSFPCPVGGKIETPKVARHSTVERSAA